MNLHLYEIQGRNLRVILGLKMAHYFIIPRKISVFFIYSCNIAIFLLDSEFLEKNFVCKK